jgi:ADP-ribose 1''-phosphate phosphatase
MLFRCEEMNGDLFANKQQYDVLVHACSCTGSWGAGIAKEFGKRFPLAKLGHDDFLQMCRVLRMESLGKSYLSRLERDSKDLEKTHSVGCLFTSRGYGKAKGEPGVILDATMYAIEYLLRDIEASTPGDQPIRIASPCINAGLFGVPWHLTREIILKALWDHPRIYWQIWRL